jgi:TolA-binding protein
VQALHQIRQARTTTLGLFLRYDPERLRRAEELLQEVVAAEPPGTFLQLEARWYLGKVNLAQGEVEPARDQFKTVAQQQGHHAHEAAELLLELQRVAPAQPPSGFGPDV